MSKGPAQEAFEALGQVPIPIEKISGGVKLGEGFQAQMRAYDKARNAAALEAASQDLHA